MTKTKVGASELSDLQERVAELEAELDLWKNQPWQLEHDYPHGSAGGRRRGESEASETLNDLQINAMINYLAENSEAVSIGSIILLMEYLGSLAFANQFNDLDMAIDDIRRGLVTDRYSPVKTGIEELRLETLERVDDLITFRVTSDLQHLAETYQKHTDGRARAK
jgi:hypothetical protein